MRNVVLFCVLSSILSACASEGVCKGSEFGTPATSNARCELVFSDCGSNSDDFQVTCDDAGSCTCFENNTETLTFTDANFCNIVFAAAEGNEDSVAEMRGSANSSCGFGVTAVEAP
jgi:hypothetical protein